MSPRIPAPNARPSFLVIACLALGLTALGIGAHGLVAAASPHVHALVAAGQAALARNDRGSAALFLERARLLAPRAASVRAAIGSAGIDDAEAPLPRAVRLLTSQEWATLATAFGWIAAIAAAFALAKNGSRLARRVAITAALSFVLALTAVVESNASRPAIVSSAETRLLVAPYSAAPSDTTLPAGTMVLPGGAYDSFVHVRTADGASGWIPQRSIDGISARSI